MQTSREQQSAARTEHGVATYSKGKCRCRRCKNAWSAYMLDYRSRGTRRRDQGYFYGKRAGGRVRLTTLGSGIVRAFAERTGQRIDDVIEGALRRVAVQD